MSDKRIEPDQVPEWLDRMEALLEQARLQRRTLTYLRIADELALPGPYRIHKTTQLIERLLRRDADLGRVPLAALAVSRARPGLPAPGFFESARRLGLHDDSPDDRYHQQLLDALFSTDASNAAAG